MSRRDYLKHLGFATSATLLTNQPPPMTLPKETQQAIANRAALYADQQHAHKGDDIHVGYVAGATEWAGKAQGPLIDLLDEARVQIEYLHKKFGETGSGNNVLARIETELAKYKEVSNG
jgi:hypothetical protein